MVKMPHWPIPWRNHIKYDLTRIKLLLSALQNPHLKVPPVIHVAGTNGKGSTIAYLRAIFETTGYKVHSYTSPHLLNFNERITIASEYIDDRYLFNIIEKTRTTAAKVNITPTFFEGTTAAAFLAFAENKADILLLETGMGGRLDATNVIDNPIATIITPISYDHMEYLGPTLTTIAAEKAGIIKANAPCIISCQAQQVYDLLIDYAIRVKAIPIVYEYDFGIQKQNDSFKFLSHNFTYQFSLPSLPGNHQVINAATAITTCKAITKHFNFSANDIQKGISNTVWPARLEKIDLLQYDKIFNIIMKHLYKKNIDVPHNIPQIWLDGAHNTGGAQSLSNFIRENLTPPIYLILGMTSNREVKPFLSYFTDIVTQIFTVSVISEPASYDAEKLAAYANSSGIISIPTESLTDAIIAAIKSNQAFVQQNGNIIITGSLFLMADFYNLIRG
nr:folylpolyglutamate synthase/dihydrofolate synthase family protein [Orientia tsutsugamushi]